MLRLFAVLASLASILTAPAASAGIHPTCPAPHHQTGGVFEEIAVPGAHLTAVRAINERGDVVGTYDGPAGWRAFFLRRGEYLPLDVPGCINEIPSDINAAGLVAGYCYSEEHRSWAGFIWTPDGRDPVTFTIAGHPYVSVNAISESGGLVGHYTLDAESAPVHGFLYRRDGLQTVDYPGATWTEVLDIDAGGNLLVRTAGTTGVSYYIHSRKGFTPLQACDASLSPEWRGMTNNGTFTGYVTDPISARSVGFLYSSKRREWTLIEYPGATFTMLWSAVSSGVAVGFAIVPMPNGTGRQVSFVFKPHGR